MTMPGIPGYRETETELLYDVRRRLLPRDKANPREIHLVWPRVGEEGRPEEVSVDEAADALNRDMS